MREKYRGRGRGRQGESNARVRRLSVPLASSTAQRVDDADAVHDVRARHGRRSVRTALDWAAPARTALGAESARRGRRSARTADGADGSGRGQRAARTAPVTDGAGTGADSVRHGRRSVWTAHTPGVDYRQDERVLKRRSERAHGKRAQPHIQPSMLGWRGRRWRARPRTTPAPVPAPNSSSSVRSKFCPNFLGEGESVALSTRSLFGARKKNCAF